MISNATVLKCIQSINPIKAALIAGSLLFSCALILLNNSGVLPLALGDFIFFSGLVFLCALYRPGWVFLFFIGVLPFEIVTIAPQEIGFMLRPYQWVGILTLIAVATRYAFGRLPFSIPKIRRLDWLLLLLWAGSLASAFYAPNRNISLKQSIVLLSFVALYALVRIFVRTVEDVKNTLAFFIGSGVIVSLYAIWQNIRFAGASNAFEVMAGRPNSVFTEPDWMGAFLVVSIAAVYAMLWMYQKSKGSEKNFVPLDWKLPFILTFRRIILTGLFVLLTLLYSTLIISVSRSAWLSVAFVSLVAWGVVLADGALLSMQQWKWRESLIYAMSLAATFVVSLGLAVLFHLTSFGLFNRAQSTASGLQLITVACTHDILLPDTIASVDELAAYDCRHINLEDKEAAANRGEIVKEIYRSDPNVSIRREIYAKTFGIIREHFLTGIGFGSIASFLGNDERGAGLNTSNIFLEVWIGSGLIGLFAFVCIWFSIGYASLKRLWLRHTNNYLSAIYTFLFLSWIGLTVFNLFNAGLFLGFFWAWLAVAVSFAHKKAP
jgi:hypothetical protein